MAVTNFGAAVAVLFVALFYNKSYLQSDNFDSSLPFGVLSITFERTKPIPIGFEALHTTLKFERSSMSSSKYQLTRWLSMSLLVLSGDIQLNPGPGIKCGICTKATKLNQRFICCESCDQLYHTDCCFVPDNVHSNSTCIWVCGACGICNFSGSHC